MANGDYLWRVNDSAKTRRESPSLEVDADAYEEYGGQWLAWCGLWKPIPP